ncbi:MAG TPA: LiaF domain-containing protein, partial [Actinomycetota bacterium]|nr:LiaF domain-containing protein [Actinomycetota bacterium]
ILPAVLIALGLALVVAAPRGGSQGGPIALGIVLTLILLAGTVVDVPFRGGVGDRTYRPSTVADHTYELAVGKLTIDLSRSGVPVAVPDHVVIRAHVGVGQLVVVVPARFGSVDVRARAGIGQTDLFGQTQDGFGVEDRSPVTNDAGPLLRMDLSVGIGRVEVRSG